MSKENVLTMSGKLNFVLVACLLATVCGAPADEVEDKIIEGRDANMRDTCHIASIQNYEEISDGQYIRRKMSKFCGGTVLSKRWVLSAAHCFENYDLKTLHIHAGVAKAFCYDDIRSQLIKIKRVYVHEQYDKEKITNDMALLLTEKPIKFGPTVCAAKLPPKNFIAPHNQGMICGWGKTGDIQKDKCYMLQYAPIQVLSNEECKKVWGHLLQKDNICCAGKSSTCGGDSGGPLTQIVNGQLYVMGATSFGSVTCSVHPSAFASTTYHHDWLTTTLAREIRANHITDDDVIV